ncbi:MAG: HNH/ENDO VII family nuclease [Candidatus Omnitrophica bacterium]|nr:HNH/ENDO VII family nuclease [Candidatus Omnitrophota bacterium]
MQKFQKVLILFGISIFLNFNPCFAQSSNNAPDSQTLSPHIQTTQINIQNSFNLADNELSLGFIAHRKWADGLPFLHKYVNMASRKTNQQIKVEIKALTENEIAQAVNIHNANWGNNFKLSNEDAKEMFEANPGGQLIARVEGEIIGVVWCVSLQAESIEEIPGSLVKISSIKRQRATDNVWLHYAVSVKGDYLKQGFGPQISSELLKSTAFFTDKVPGVGNMLRGTYSPISGYSQFKNEMTSTAYLMMKLRPPKEGQTKVEFLDWEYWKSASYVGEGKMTFRQFLESINVNPENMRWEDYQKFIAYSGYTLGNYIIDTKRAIVCLAGNLHLKNGAEIVRVIPGGRQGDQDAAEYAMIIVYRDFPLKQDLKDRINQLKQKKITSNELIYDNLTFRINPENYEQWLDSTQGQGNLLTLEELLKNAETQGNAYLEQIKKIKDKGLPLLNKLFTVFLKREKILADQYQEFFRQVMFGYKDETDIDVLMQYNRFMQRISTAIDLDFFYHDESSDKMILDLDLAPKHYQSI